MFDSDDAGHEFLAELASLLRGESNDDSDIGD